jgi:hypothetical protein
MSASSVAAERETIPRSINITGLRQHILASSTGIQVILRSSFVFIEKIII